MNFTVCSTFVWPTSMHSIAVLFRSLRLQSSGRLKLPDIENVLPIQAISAFSMQKDFIGI
jgi:hypothetical protein